MYYGRGGTDTAPTFIFSSFSAGPSGPSKHPVEREGPAPCVALPALGRQAVPVLSPTVRPSPGPEREALAFHRLSAIFLLPHAGSTLRMPLGAELRRPSEPRPFTLEQDSFPEVRDQPGPSHQLWGLPGPSLVLGSL